MSKDFEVRVGGLEKTVEDHGVILKDHARSIVEHATEIFLLKDSVDKNTQANKDLVESHKETNKHLAEILGGLKALKWFIPFIISLMSTAVGIVIWLLRNS